MFEKISAILSEKNISVKYSAFDTKAVVYIIAYYEDFKTAKTLSKIKLIEDKTANRVHRNEKKNLEKNRNYVLKG